MASGKPLEDSILDGAQEIACRRSFPPSASASYLFRCSFLTGVAHYLFVPLAESVVFAMLASYGSRGHLWPTLVMWFYRNVSTLRRTQA